jgi:hypothetical protein
MTTLNPFLCNVMYILHSGLNKLIGVTFTILDEYFWNILKNIINIILSLKKMLHYIIM